MSGLFYFHPAMSGLTTCGREISTHKSTEKKSCAKTWAFETQGSYNPKFPALFRREIRTYILTKPKTLAQEKAAGIVGTDVSICLHERH